MIQVPTIQLSLEQFNRVSIPYDQVGMFPKYEHHYSFGEFRFMIKDTPAGGLLWFILESPHTHILNRGHLLTNDTNLAASHIISIINSDINHS
jgi:hypothetical protein